MPPAHFLHNKLVLQEFSRIRTVALCDLLGSSAANDLTAALAALDRRALAAVDWGLLATFACFFVFAGNLARVPEVSAWLSPLMAEIGKHVDKEGGGSE